MQAETYLYDGSFEGLLSAVAQAVKTKGSIKAITPHDCYRPELFETPTEVVADPLQARSLMKYLRGLHFQASRLAVNGYLSEDPAVGTHLYHFIKLCLRHGKSAAWYRSNPSVAYLGDLAHKMGFEAHRLKGLIRFRILEDGLPYAPFEPDHNVIGLCAGHFKKRLAGQRWMLHDIRRNLALYWDTRGVQPVDVAADFTAYVAAHGEVPPGHLTAEEQRHQKSWANFHTAIVNPHRENKQLQRQFMPRRYWKYLTEEPKEK